MSEGEKGFTLIEILIAVIIFSFVIWLASYSFSFYTSLIKKITQPYPETAINFSKLREAVDDAFFYVGQKRDLLGKVKDFIYFYGSKNEMKFITTKPFFYNEPCVCKLYFDNDSIKWEESPVYSKYDNYKSPELTQNNLKKITLWKNVSGFKLEYIVDKEKVSSIKEKIPSLVQISFNKKGKLLVFYFNVRSDFKEKLFWTKYINAPPL